MVAIMTFKELDRDIFGLREMARRYRDIDDNYIADKCGISVSQIQHKAAEKELPKLSFWAVYQIAKLAGYKVEFTRNE